MCANNGCSKKVLASALGEMFEMSSKLYFLIVTFQKQIKLDVVFRRNWKATFLQGGRDINFVILREN